MPGQRQKGKKNKRRTRIVFATPEPEGDQILAQVETTHGGYPARFGCKPIDGSDVIIAPIQGSISKGPRRVLIRKEDYVLLDKLECATGKDSYYIHHVYTKDDLKHLESRGHLIKKATSAEESTNTKIIISDVVEQKAEKIEEDEEIDIDNI